MLQSTVIRASAPRLNPVREWAGSASRPTPRSFCCHNLPPTFPPLSTSSFVTRLPSTVAYYSRAPEPHPDSAGDQLDEPDPNVQSLRESNGGGEGSDRSQDANMLEDSPQQEYFHGIPIEVANNMPKDSPQQEYVYGFPKEDASMPEDSPQQEYFNGIPIEYIPLLAYWKSCSREEIREICRATSLAMNYGEEALDNFYREMSKEVETILHEGDPRLPEELFRRVVVTCVSEDCKDNDCIYVYVLRRRKGRKDRSQVRAAKESCREVEVEFTMTYLVDYKARAFNWPNDKFPFGVSSIPHKLKVVNKFEFSGGDVYGVASEEARKYAGWLIAQNKLRSTLDGSFVWHMRKQLSMAARLAFKDMGKDMSNASLLHAKGVDRLEVPLKKLAVSTVRMLSSLSLWVSRLLGWPSHPVSTLEGRNEM